MLINCFAVGAGGAIGAIFCYLLLCLFPVASPAFPLVTMGINIAGSFCVGLVIGATDKIISLDPHLLLLLKVGFCGGFTTFSTFSFESLEMLQNGKIIIAVIYTMLSVILCIAAVGCAQAVIK